MNTIEYEALIKSERLKNKNKWINFSVIINKVTVSIKFYNTWIQCAEISDGITLANFDTNMECSVKMFNECINAICLKIDELNK